MTKKILLVNPPNTMPADSVRRIGEPLGLLYLGAVLKSRGYGVSIFDMVCEGYDHCKVKDGYVTYGSTDEDLAKRLKDLSPNIVGISCMFTAREENALRTCSVVRRFNKGLPIVVGGLHPSLFPERFLNSGFADYVILGEGEFRIAELMKCLENGVKPSFDGVAFVSNEQCIINPMHKRIEDLDTVPLPDRDLIDMDQYIGIGSPYAPFSLKERVAQILATRGCPNRCNFCSTVSYWGRKIRARSVDNIIGEMKLLKDRYRIEEIQFVDDNLTFNKKFARELFIRMKKFGFKWCTPHGLMFNTLDEEMIRLMSESGAYQLTFAIESASERVLREIIHKSVNLKIVKNIVEEAHRYDIGVHGMFVMGFPGEKREEILRTLEFPFRAGFDSVSFFIVNPLPGSELYDACNRKGYLVENYSAMDFKTVNIRIPEDSPDYVMEPDELIKLIDEKTREFNEWSRKRYPERWKRKFERYLESHPEDKKIIMGRVT